MKEIKKIDVLSFAILQAVVMAIVGLLQALFYAVVGSFIAMPGSNIAALGFIGIIMFPLVLAISGFFAGAIGAFIYNIAAKWVGGVKINLVEIKEKK